MAKVIVSGNLNIYGNNGQFETDRSTWGFGDGGDFVTTRSSDFATAGTYSALLTNPLAGLSNEAMIPCSWNGIIGKKYIIKAQIRTPSANPLGSSAEKFNFRASLSNFMFGLTEIDFVEKTILESTDTWVQVEISVLASGAPLGTTYGLSLCGLVSGNAGGKLYVDQFEVYEYIDDDAPDPDPEDPEPEETDRVFHSKNPITLGKTAPGGWDALNNFRLYCDVRVEDVADSFTYNSKIKLELPPESDGSVVFYLMEAFRGVFKFTPPTLNQNTIVRLTDRIKRFKHFTGELEDLEVTPGALEESLPNLVLWGGINKYHFPSLNYFTDYLPTNKKFLTWAPLDKYLDRLQEDYLNFWVYDNFATLKLNLKVYFDDNTNETAVTTELAGSVYGELYQVPAGPFNSGATLVNPAKNIVKYELSLLNQDDEAITEVRTYYVNKNSHPLARYFMFLNSLGTFEVLRFTGQAADTTDFKRDVVQKFLAHNYAALDGEFAINGVMMDERKSFGSGFVKNKSAAEWHEYHKDFLLSPIAFDVTDGQRKPIVILSGSHSREDQNYERFIRFEAKPAYDNDSFTPEVI